ncbi:L-histidine N(alpha)-methyltransferase [Pelagibius litoralis]|uniref:L-histidine N(Alpha)-methyltransferase n=1 Tax=Pelagibius litoralis TaxID=374515 RepID=A0A967CC82_9PROT|nr:L-histidine N(alpha)-methyltransferase [Pelagibius litoralis]NIA68893.1 L-histidine N(alpha)-methyltransferase [Pelagibius litoralis]
MTAVAETVLDAKTEPRPIDEAFLASVLSGLSKRQKTIESKYFYDARGSQLFDAITDLDEYYLTRAETALLKEQSAEIATLIGTGATLVEFGSGSSVKTRILLDALAALRLYVPIDISGEHLDAAAKQVAADFSLPVIPLHADYTSRFTLPHQVSRDRLVGFFPGSTIGNFEPDEAAAFLDRVRSLLGPAARLLVGADLQKDPARLEAAYDDAQGVTAAFNLNLLVRINRELGGDFSLEAFRHKALYNAEEGRVEMHLVSLADQSLSLGGRQIDFTAGETIHTENSYKYSLESFRELAQRGGWRSEAAWTDPEGLFSFHALIAE